MKKPLYDQINEKFYEGDALLPDAVVRLSDPTSQDFALLREASQIVVDMNLLDHPGVLHTLWKVTHLVRIACRRDLISLDEFKTQNAAGPSVPRDL